MKQKRKVKCLLPNKIEWRKNMLSALLFILSVVLCVGSVSLLTSCAWADEITFTGLDEKAEVLYEINFVKQNDASANISKMYVSGGNLYSTPAPLIVKTNVNHGQNTIGDNKYGHILGGRGNNLYSKYVTLIGGYYNNIFRDNIVLLGGNNNNITGDLAVVIGGSGNKVNFTAKHNIIIGGNNNISSGESNFLLGSSIIISNQDSKNNIIGGNNIKIGETRKYRKNIFAYSNTINQISPKTDNAFYLDVIGGVGFNRPSVNQGLAVSGAVSIGEIYNNATCDDNTLGVIGSYNGCLVGCTYASLYGTYYNDTRELLDLSDDCKVKCENWKNIYEDKKCLYTGENNNSINNSSNDYTGFCLTGNSIYNFDNTKLCDENKLNEYKNVVFEATLTGNCSSNRENICEYKCKDGYDFFPNDGIYDCKKKCYINIDDTNQTWKHGTTGEYYINKNSCDTSDNKCKSQKIICDDGIIYKYEDGVEVEEIEDPQFYTECKECCEYNGNWVKHNGTGMFYITGSAICPDTCEGSEFTCDDGVWRNSDGKERKNYPATGCSLENQICEGYTITRDQYSKLSENDKKNGVYTECTKYEAEDNICNENGKMYSLICKDGYHLKKDGISCESDYQINGCEALRDVKKPPYAVYTGGGTFKAKGQEIDYNPGQYIVISKFPRYKTGYLEVESASTSTGDNDWDHSQSIKQCLWECESDYSKRIAPDGTYYCYNPNPTPPCTGDDCPEPPCTGDNCPEPNPEPKSKGDCIIPIEEDENRESRVRYDTGENLTENVTGTLFRDVIEAQKFIESGGVCAYVCGPNKKGENLYYYNNKCELPGETPCDEVNRDCFAPYYKTEGTGVVISGEKWKCAVNSNTGGIAKLLYCFVCDDGLTAYDGEGKIITPPPLGKEEYNKYINLMCLKNTCNHCANNGFPYCFPIDFTPSCSEGLWLRGER